MLFRGRGSRGARVEVAAANCSIFVLGRRSLILRITCVPLRRAHRPLIICLEAQFHGDQCTELQKPLNKVNEVGRPVVLPSQEGVVLFRAGRQSGSNPAPVLPSGYGVGVTSREGSDYWSSGCLTSAQRRNTYHASSVEVTGTTRGWGGRRINAGSIERKSLSRGSGGRMAVLTCEVIGMLPSDNVSLHHDLITRTHRNGGGDL